MHDAKAAKTLRITKEEGAIVIKTIEREFPDVFKMVIEASMAARANGYLVLNERTKSRAWFPNIIKVIKGEMDIKENFGIISKEMSEARNIRIQGTQADAIKEATVELQAYIDEHELDVIILQWVHDEIIDIHHKSLDQPILSYTDDDGNVHTNKTFPEVKRLIMANVFNRYLENVTIEVDGHVMPYWTK